MSKPLSPSDLFDRLHRIHGEIEQLKATNRAALARVSRLEDALQEMLDLSECDCHICDTARTAARAALEAHP